MNLFIKQKELNAQENDKYLAIQEFKCNVSPSNLDAEDVGVQSNDQTQQQIIQDKLEIVFDLSSHDSKNNNEVSNQLSDNSFINFKKGKSQRRSKGHSNGGAAESLIYSQSSCNVVNKKFESQRFSEPRFRENILKEVDLNIQRKSVDVQAKQSIKNENSNNNNNNNNETQTINRQPTQEINRLIQLDQSPKCSTYRRQSSIGSVWQVFVQLMKIVQKLRLKDQIEKISHFIGDKSHQKKDQINKEKMSKKKQIKFNEQLNQNNNIQIINQYQQQQKQLKSQINYAQPSFSFASFIYDSISILIAFLSFIYYSALLIIQPSLTNSNEHYRKLFCGFFIAFYVTDIIKELILIIFSQTQKSLSQIINCLKAYTRSQFLFDIVSLFSIIIIEIIHTDIVQNYNVAIIFVLFFLFFKFFTIYNKWINILNYFLYSQRLSTCLKIVKLLAQISFLLHTFTLIYYVISYFKQLIKIL